MRHVAPGEHGQIAKKLGAPHTHVPYLTAGGEVIQGSTNIIDWAENTTSQTAKQLTPDADCEECARIEKRVDDVAGVHVRRFFYSEALVEHPGTVRPIFTGDLPLRKKIFISMIRGKIRKIMIARMDLGRKQGQESRDITAGELDWLDELLSDGRNFLVGDQFSCADIAVASILAPLALPPQHPSYHNIKHPPRMAMDVANWDQRPSLIWLRKIYAQFR